VNRGDETISPAVHRLNKPRGTRRIAQQPAQFPNGYLEHRLTHCSRRPDGRQQRVFGYQLAGLLHQTTEDCQDFWGKMNNLLAAPQAFVAPV
jgi:hypothetical protein